MQRRNLSFRRGRRCQYRALFKGWSKADNFKNVMNKAYIIAINALEKLQADGREPADNRMTKLLASLQTHSDAQRYDQATKIVEKFKRRFAWRFRHIGRWAALTLNP